MNSEEPSQMFEEKGEQKIVIAADDAYDDADDNEAFYELCYKLPEKWTFMFSPTKGSLKKKEILRTDISARPPCLWKIDKGPNIEVLIVSAHKNAIPDDCIVEVVQLSNQRTYRCATKKVFTPYTLVLYYLY
jgi:hypothetical protein